MDSLKTSCGLCKWWAQYKGELGNCFCPEFPSSDNLVTNVDNWCNFFEKDDKSEKDKEA